MTCCEASRLWVFGYGLALILGQYISFKRIFLYKCIKVLKGSFPHWHGEDRGQRPRDQDSQGTLSGALPERLLWVLSHSGLSSHLYLVSKDWASQMAELCWVNVKKGKKLETRMGSRHRKSGCNLWPFLYERLKYDSLGWKIESSRTWKSYPSRQLIRVSPDSSLTWRNLSDSHPQSLGFLKLLVGSHSENVPVNMPLPSVSFKICFANMSAF